MDEKSVEETEQSQSKLNEFNLDGTQEESKKDAPIKLQVEEIDFEERYKKYEDLMSSEAIIR